MATIDTILGFAIPAIIIITLAIALWGKFSDPIHRFYDWIRDLFGWGKDKLNDGSGYVQEEIIFK